MTDQWYGMNTPPAVTRVSVTSQRSEITRPDGTRYVQLSDDRLGGDKGLLPYRTELRDAGGALLTGTNIIWEAGADEYRSLRVRRTESVDELGATTAREFGYDPSSHQLIEIREYDYGGLTLLRKTQIEYEPAQGYVDRHIFNLPKTVKVYGNVNRDEAISRIEYRYDGQPLATAPGIVQHSDAYDPSRSAWVPTECHRECDPERMPPCHDVCTPGHWEGGFDPATNFRGHVTRITRYADANNFSGAIAEQRAYDVAGNLRTVTGSSCCEQISFTYTPDTQYAFPTMTTLGATAPNSPVRVTASAAYDLSTGLPLSVTDENGRVVEVAYDDTSLRPSFVYWKPSASSQPDSQTEYRYNDAGVTVYLLRHAARVPRSGPSQHLNWSGGSGRVVCAGGNIPNTHPQDRGPRISPGQSH